MGWAEPCREHLLAPGPGSLLRPWALTTWHLPDLHGVPRRPLWGNGRGGSFSKNNCRPSLAREWRPLDRVCGVGAGSRAPPSSPGPSDIPSDVPSWPHAILGIKASPALHDHKKGPRQRPGCLAHRARNGARLAVSGRGVLLACVQESLWGKQCGLGLLPPSSPQLESDIALCTGNSQTSPLRPFQPTPVGQASQERGAPGMWERGSCSTSLVRGSEKPNLSFWRLRNIVLPGASGRTEPPVGLACAPGSDGHPFPPARWPVVGGDTVLWSTDDSAVCREQPGSQPPCSAGHTGWTLAVDRGPVPAAP